MGEAVLSISTRILWSPLGNPTSLSSFSSTPHLWSFTTDRPRRNIRNNFPELSLLFGTPSPTLAVGDALSISVAYFSLDLLTDRNALASPNRPRFLARQTPFLPSWNPPFHSTPPPEEVDT